MITLKVKVTFDEEVLGTASSNPDIFKEYIASNAPDALTMKEEVEALGTDGVFEKNMTVFLRDKHENPILLDYQWKGFFKDAFASLKKIPGTECGKIKAFKKEIDGLIFVYPRQIPIQTNGEMGICQRPLRASTPQGERVALACSETVPAGSSVVIEIQCLLDSHEKAVVEALNYGRMRGFGQWRNGGKGRFHYEILDRKEEKLAI